MRKMMMYVFAGDRLAGMQDVTGWTRWAIVSARQAVHMIGRTAEISDRGRAVCHCRADLGARDIPAGEISHGYCDLHFTAAMNDVAAMEVTK